MHALCASGSVHTCMTKLPRYSSCSRQFVGNLPGSLIAMLHSLCSTIGYVLWARKLYAICGEGGGGGLQ